MKKFLLLALVAVMSLVANAQFVTSPMKKDIHVAQPARPMKAVSLVGTEKWGYYYGDETGYQGIGLQNQSAGRFDVAIFVPGSTLLSGAKLCGVNMPGFADSVTGITAWASNTLGGEKIAEANYTGKYNEYGYTQIPFDEEIVIPSTGLYVGYSFDLKISTQYDSYPFAFVQGGAPGSFYIGQNYSNFMDAASQGFTSPMQVFVKDLNYTDNAAVVSGVHAEACAVNGKGTVTIYLSSDCKNGVKNVDYTLVVNGVETTGRKVLSPAIPGGLAKTGSFDVEFDAPSTIGAFNASIAVTKVNGAANEASTDATPFTVKTVSRIVPRMTVVEEYTGTGCGYCPRGWVGMETVKNNQSDKALVIAWHNYNSSDPMFQDNYANIPFDGAPGCWVDRKTYPDPYYGEVEEGIMECVNKYNKAVPTVDVKVKASFVDDTNSEVKVTSDTEFLTNTKGYTIAYVLTADELKGTTSAWGQSNYYYQYTAADAGVLPEMPELADFCKGGKYGKSKVSLTFNDVMIGSSYNEAGRSLVPAFRKGKAGDVEASEFTVAMPTKAALLKTLLYDKIYVTALVFDENGAIANAARVRVLGAGEGGDDPITPDPIEIDGLKVSQASDEIQIMGEAMSPNAKYVVGTNYATFAPVVWNVETGAVTDFADYEEGAFHAANSNGVFVGDDGNGEGFAIKVDSEGNVTPLYREVGEEVYNEEFDFYYSTGDAGSSAYAVSEDGKTIAGFYFDSAYKTTPCIWNENNQRIDLPVPSSDEAGIEVNGAEVRYMTPDAKTLVGFLFDNMSTWPACIWRQNSSGGYDVDMIYKDYWEEDFNMGKPYMVFNPTAISANGEWIALQIQKEYDSWDYSVPQPALQIARLNLTTKALEILPVEDESYTPTGIANNGSILAYSGGNDMIGRVGYLWAAGKTELVDLDAIFTTVPELQNLASNTPCSITADGAYIEGFGINGEDIISYVFDYAKYETSGIKDVKVENKVSVDRIYNINGQQVKNMNGRGLYIINGKKVTVK